MDMYQKKKMRQEKKNNDSQESFSKVSISWYPGHMLKTKKQIIEDLKLIDVVVELLDARIPKSSRNPDIQKIVQNKKRIVLLNKRFTVVSLLLIVGDITVIVCSFMLVFLK